MSKKPKKTIVIAEIRYSVHQLSEAQRQTYWEFIDELAKERLNPWKDLHEKIKDLPIRLQEIVFVGSRKCLFPLTPREKTEIWCSVDAIMRLLEVSLDVLHGLCLHSPQDTKDIANNIVHALNLVSRPELLQVYTDLMALLRTKDFDSYTGTEEPAEPVRHLSGPEAIDFLRGVKAAKEKPMNPPTREMEVPPTEVGKNQ